MIFAAEPSAIGGGVGWKTPARERGGRERKNPANGGETPGGWLEKRKNTLRLIRSLKKTRTRPAAVGRKNRVAARASARETRAAARPARFVGGLGRCPLRLKTREPLVAPRPHEERARSPGLASWAVGRYPLRWNPHPPCEPPSWLRPVVGLAWPGVKAVGLAPPLGRAQVQILQSFSWFCPNKPDTWNVAGWWGGVVTWSRCKSSEGGHFF